MKKILLVMAALFCVATVSAQQKWAVGARIGSGFQADAEWFYSGDKYVEGRLGMSWVLGGVCADFTVLHNWNVCNMNWTPSVGTWFFDAGVGLNVGGVANLATLGVAGQAKLGLKFKKVPIRLAVDFTPAFGPAIIYWNGGAVAGFNDMGICNLGVSATYCF